MGIRKNKSGGRYNNIFNLRSLKPVKERRKNRDIIHRR